jgi:formate-dependent phosphoribosylglycinamide formyltransferase (GAR transformylase)
MRHPFSEQFSGRAGYILLRGVEAGIAIVGVLLMVAAIPVLFAESTPAPAGVGIMLLLMAVGLGILLTSFVRAGAELFIYRDTSQ